MDKDKLAQLLQGSQVREYPLQLYPIILDGNNANGRFCSQH